MEGKELAEHGASSPSSAVVLPTAPTDKINGGEKKLGLPREGPGTFRKPGTLPCRARHFPVQGPSHCRAGPVTLPSRARHFAAVKGPALCREAPGTFPARARHFTATGPALCLEASGTVRVGVSCPTT